VDTRERLHRQFVAEEVASALRHRLVNKVAAVGALNFHLKRQLPPETPSAATSVLPLIDAEVAQASQALDLRFLAPPASVEAVALAAVLDDGLGLLPRPAGIELVGPGAVTAVVRGDAGELVLAVRCLAENALEAARAQVRVRVTAAEPRAGVPLVAIEIEDDGPGLDEAGRRQAREPFFTTRPGHLGLGLNIALRIAQRGQGALELGGRAGLVARLLLPLDGA
jgi:signal transduction histidine kinase